MEQVFSFQVTPLDPGRLCPQVSRALEKRAELISRQKYPKMWELTDKLNSAEKVPQAVRENRKKRRGFLGLLNWLLGLFLLIPGLMEPQTLLIPLLVGAACFGVGIVTLWRNKRTLLGFLSLIKGVVLCVGVLGTPGELDRLLALGCAGIVIGLAALLTRKRERENPFDQAARNLVEKKNGLKGLEQIRCTFSSEGMNVGWEGTEQEAHTTPYSSFVFVLETEDLLLPIYHDCMFILQKKDLLAGTIPQLREFLSRQTRYIFVPEQQEVSFKDAT